jgi:uncharacterized protein YoxC
VQVGEVIFVIALNCIIIYILFTIQQKSLEKRIKHVKNEVQDLEDLVAAIIEEFEEIAEATESKFTETQNTISESTTVIEATSETQTEITNNFDTEITKEVTEVMNTGENLSSDKDVILEVAPVNESEVQVVPFQTTQYFRPVNDPKHQQILDLWEQGVSVEEIARHLGTGRGEVQLILGIYRRS